MTEHTIEHPVHRFGIMGTFAELHLRAPAEVATPLFEDAEAELQRLNDLLTRFDPDSPMEQLNDAGGGEVSGEIREILYQSLDAWHASNGRFSIAVGSELLAAGYDKDFDELDVPDEGDLPPATGAQVVAGATGGEPPAGGAAPHRGPGFSLVGDTLRIEPGVRLDLGGIGKGWSADAICRMLSPHGSCLVNLGGDISLHVREGDESWPVGVDLGGRTTSFAIAYGGLATSGQDRRVWRGEDGELAHHIIDPFTGKPAATDILRCTVFASSCAEAEVWSKSLMIEGFDGASGEADAWGITSIIVACDGRLALTGGLAGVEV